MKESTEVGERLDYIAVLPCDLLARATQAQAVVRTIIIALTGKDTRNRTETYRIKTCCANHYAISPCGRFKVNREPHISLTCASTASTATFFSPAQDLLPHGFNCFSGRGNHLLFAPMVPRTGFEPATCSPCFMVRTAALPLSYRSVLQASPTDAPFNSLRRYPHGLPDLCIGLTCYGISTAYDL